METKKWRIPVVFELCGCITVEETTLAEAMQAVRENPEKFPLPDNRYYVDGSFRLATDDEEIVYQCYNDNLEGESKKQISNDSFAQPSVLDKDHAAIQAILEHESSMKLCERLVDAFFESVNTDDEPYYKIGRTLMQNYISCTKEQKEAFDMVLIALCGWSMLSLLKKAELIEDDDCTFHYVPTPPRLGDAGQNETCEGRESNG